MCPETVDSSTGVAAIIQEQHIHFGSCLRGVLKSNDVEAKKPEKYADYQSIGPCTYYQFQLKLNEPCELSRHERVKKHFRILTVRENVVP